MQGPRQWRCSCIHCCQPGVLAQRRLLGKCTHWWWVLLQMIFNSLSLLMTLRMMWQPHQASRALILMLSWSSIAMGSLQVRRQVANSARAAKC